MKKITRILCLLLAALLPLSVCLSACAESTPALWRVQNRETTVYLLGSIHIGVESMYPFGEAVQRAMAEADEFVYECDTDSADALLTTVQMTALIDGTTAQEHMTAEQWESVVAACVKLGLDPAQLQLFKPWAVMNMLVVYGSALLLAEEGSEATPELGVENKVREVMKQKGAVASYLEQITDQLQMMEDFSQPLQDFLLEDACNTILDPAPDNPMLSWVEWWRTGDVEAFARSYLETAVVEGYEAECAEYNDALLTKRNRVMAEGIAKRLESGERKTYFVTVGLLHLALPDDSVRSCLQETGYTITRVK